MKLNRYQTRKLINSEKEKVVNEVAQAAVIQAGLSILTNMLSSANGRDTLAKIILLLPNLITSLCESVFPEQNKDGGLLSNLKTKLCKAVGYALMGPLGITCKIIGELLLVLDDNSAKVVIEEVNKSSATPKTVEPEIVPFDLPDVPTGNVDIPYSPEMDLNMMEGRKIKITRKQLRKLILTKTQ